jgi:signal transduction histidine kinase/CheY-like chemotaxis protein
VNDTKGKAQAAGPFSAGWRWLTARLIPERVRANPDTVRRAELAIAIVAIAEVPLLARAGLFFARGPVWQGGVVLCAALLVALSLLLLKSTGSLSIVGNTITLVFFLAATSAAYLRGGLGSPPLLALGIIPLFATFLAGFRAGVVWMLAVWAEAIVFALARQRGWVLQDSYPSGSRTAIELVGALLFPVVVLGMAVAYELVKNSALRERSRALREQARAEAEAAMLRADRMVAIGQLAAGVAHEANNPLGYVTANLVFVQERLRTLTSTNVADVRPELEQALADARQGAERIARIVRDLKTFARPDESDLVELVDLRQVLDATVKIAQNEIQHRAQLVKSYDSVSPVRGNEPRLFQVFLNLLLNAAQAIPEGRVNENEISVVIDQPDPERVRVVVSDTGSGIAPEHLPRITEPFFTTKPPGVGTGLGLAVVKSIVDKLNGTLEFGSAGGRGTRVSVTLPAQAADMPSSNVVLARASLGPLKSLRILAIDDDPMVLRALRRLLKTHDLTVVAGGREALDLLRSGKEFDVILCDLMMPDLTGMDVYEHVHDFDRTLAERIVFLTGGAFTEKTREFLDSVSNQRLEKPFDVARINELLGAVHLSQSASYQRRSGA